MATEPLDPQPSGDPADGTAVIAPVTPETIEHAAHAAAEMADAAAHHAPHATHDTPHSFAGAPDDVDAASVAENHETAVETDPPFRPAPVHDAGIAPPANENATAAGSEVGGPQGEAPRAADLAFAQGDGAEAGLATSLGEASDALGRYNAKLLEFVGANLAAATSLMSALMQARSLPEAAAINADHMRRQLDAMTMQGRELLVLAQTVAFDAMRPLKDAADASRDR